MAIDSLLPISARQLRDHANASNPNASREPRAVFLSNCLNGLVQQWPVILPLSELDPAPLLDRLKKAGAEICLPRVEANIPRRFDAL